MAGLAKVTILSSRTGKNQGIVLLYCSPLTVPVPLEGSRYVRHAAENAGIGSADQLRRRYYHRRQDLPTSTRICVHSRYFLPASDRGSAGLFVELASGFVLHQPKVEALRIPPLTSRPLTACSRLFCASCNASQQYTAPKHTEKTSRIAEAQDLSGRGTYGVFLNDEG